MPANNKMFLWKTAEHSSRCVLSGERRRGEMSNIRNKQPCHDNSWRREQYRRESERGEESDRCSEMEIEEDGKGRREKKRERGRWKHFLTSALPSESACQSLLPKLLNLLFSCFFFSFFHHLIVSFPPSLVSFFFFFLTNTVEKPPGVSLGCLTVHTSLAAERGRLLYLLICVFDLLAAIFR